MKGQLAKSNNRIWLVPVVTVALWFVAAWTQPVIAQTNTFPSSGNAGIGTTTPANPLDISSNQDAVVRLIGLNNPSGGSSAQATLSFFEGATEKAKLAVNGSTATGYAGGARAFQVWNFHNAPIVFATNSVERVRIDGGGKVGIGMSPLYTLDVNGGVNGFRIKAASIQSSDTIATFENSAAIQMIVRANGTVGIGATDPLGPLDVRLTPNGPYAGLLVNYSANNGTYLRAGSASVGDVHVGDVVTRNVLLGESGGVNVGIGTSSPSYKLDVAGQIRSSTGGFRFPDGTVQLTAGGGTISGVTAGAGLTGGGTTGTLTLTNNDKGSDQFIFKNVANVAGTTQFSAASNSDAVRFAGTGGTTVSFDTGTKKITVDSSGITGSQWTTSGGNINYASGNVGIGITPTEKLHVAGNGKITGNLTVDGNINAKYQDLAEWVESSQTLPAGTVVVLDHTRSNQVVASSQVYDTRVAGVISSQPGIALGESGAGRVLVATTGRVKIKVDASAGPIQIGDLLVTSDIPGVAMKSEPLNLGGVQIHRPGTLIGKALEPLGRGRGEILVLLSLQ